MTSLVLSTCRKWLDTRVTHQALRLSAFSSAALYWALHENAAPSAQFLIRGRLPRLTGANYFFAPQMALWFVGLLAQYYLLFPLLYLVDRSHHIIPR